MKAGGVTQDFIGAVLERWRGAMTSHKASGIADFISPAVALPPLPMQTEADRLKLLKRPISAADAFAAPERALAANPVRWPQQR